MGVGIGKPKSAKGSKKGKINPSSKQKLIDGAIPRFKGATAVDLGAEPPVTVTIFSLPGLGKTHYGFTFPNVAVCDTEMKGEKVWKKFYNGQHESYRINSDGDIEAYTWDKDHVNPDSSYLYHAENWGDVAAFYDHYSRDDWVETLMFDSETDLREFAELWTLNETGWTSLYGGEGANKRVPYSLVFGKLRYILDHAKRKGKNLVYTAKAKPHYNEKGNRVEGEYDYDGYNKQFFFSGYVLFLQQGIQNEKGETIYPDHVFGKVLKCENMQPSLYPPYIVDPSYKGIVEDLVRGEPWDGSLDDYIREKIKPAMDEMGVSRS
jgi:hypothetical protein